jgi:hypothetical protein
MTTTKGRPIWQSYSDTGALDVTCPYCGAEPGRWCTREDGRVRRIPCVTRASATGAGSAAAKPRDFSEPLAGQREDR